MELQRVVGLVVAALLFAGLAVWSLKDENWAGVLAGGLLSVACMTAMTRAPKQ